MEFKDYYATLGVEPSAGEAEIKTAYRRLARKYHPDVSKEAGAEDKFKAVNEAYEALRDPQKRAAYDQLRAQGYRPGEEFHAPPNFNGGQGFDFFADMGHAGHTLDFIHGCIGLAEGDVVADGIAEEERFLEHDGDAVAKFFQGDVADIAAINKELAALGGVEPAQQRGDGAFAAAGVADYAQALAGGEAQGNIFKHLGVAGAIAEVEVAEFYTAGFV